MRPACRPLALVVFVGLAGCGSSAEVHSNRADPITSTPTASDAPTSTEVTTDTTGTTSPTDTTGTSQGSLDWGPCDDPSAEDPKLQCATLKVPLDYDAPTGDSIDMALVRVPAASDRRGAVLLNPGGPGGSGFDPVAFSGTAIASALGIDSFDLIGFDPRGVDRSGGIHCVSNEFEDRHLYIDDTPNTPEEQALKDEAETGYVDGCKQKYGDTLRFYSTENTARDMDAIRIALGDDQISFLGISYGTYLGAAYATMFPDRVRAMVLDSAFAPNGDTVEQQFETQLVGLEGAFKNWAAWCENEPTCVFTAADVGARWDALNQQLDDAPIAGPDGRLANNATLVRATGAALYAESEWPLLAQALADAENGDPSGLFSLADTYNGRNADGTFNSLFQALPIIRCASGLERQPPDDPEALAAAIRALAPRFAGNFTAHDVTSEADDCNQLVGHVDPLTLSYAGDGPIVVVGGVNDPATPIRWAQKMTGLMGPNAQLVTFTGEGHGQLLVSTCVTDIEGSLLADLRLPEPNTVCDPDPLVVAPDWWDAVPVPDGISAPVALPTLAAALGADPTQVFGEFRTTTLSVVGAETAYLAALRDAGWEPVDPSPTIPIIDASEEIYTDQSGNALAVIALGKGAFDRELEAAKSEVPADTTVVWLFAVPI